MRTNAIEGFGVQHRRSPFDRNPMTTVIALVSDAELDVMATLGEALLSRRTEPVGEWDEPRTVWCFWPAHRDEALGRGGSQLSGRWGGPRDGRETMQLDTKKIPWPNKEASLGERAYAPRCIGMAADRSNFIRETH